MNSNPKKRSALGKGLSALLENSETDITTKSGGSGLVNSVSMLPVKSISFSLSPYANLAAINISSSLENVVFVLLRWPD